MVTLGIDTHHLAEACLGRAVVPSINDSTGEETETLNRGGAKQTPTQATFVGNLVAKINSILVEAVCEQWIWQVPEHQLLMVIVCMACISSLPSKS